MSDTTNQATESSDPFAQFCNADGSTITLNYEELMAEKANAPAPHPADETHHHCGRKIAHNASRCWFCHCG